jgi:hypothetical protein
MLLLLLPLPKVLSRETRKCRMGNWKLLKTLSMRFKFLDRAHLNSTTIEIAAMLQSLHHSPAEQLKERQQK